MSRVTFAPITDALALPVIAAMRRADRRELAAAMPDSSPAGILAMCRAASAGAVLLADGRPVAVIGAAHDGAGVWRVGMFATDDWPLAARAATRWVRRVFTPALRVAGARRAYCQSIVDHTDAHRWLACLGAQREGDLPYGQNGEIFVQFAWS